MSGTPTPSDQWQRNGADIAGARYEFATCATVAGDDGGVFRCVASNSAGTATSAGALLTV